MMVTNSSYVNHELLQLEFQSLCSRPTAANKEKLRNSTTTGFSFRLRFKRYFFLQISKCSQILVPVRIACKVLACSPSPAHNWVELKLRFAPGLYVPSILCSHISPIPRIFWEFTHSEYEKNHHRNPETIF